MKKQDPRLKTQNNILASSLCDSSDVNSVSPLLKLNCVTALKSMQLLDSHHYSKLC